MSKGNKFRRKCPTAKFMNLVTRPQTHRDRKNDYRRKPKYRAEW